MPLSVDWPNKFITVPKSELTLISGTRYKITVSYWWQLLREMNETEEGIVFDTMYNSTAATSSTPQIVDLINGYTAEFEDGLYSVELVDGNTNWREIEIKNSVSVGTNNTTGFIDPTFLEAGLFDGAVCLDTVNGVAGTDKTPSGGIIGTRQTPSNNIADTHTISDYRGLRVINLVNSFILSDEDLSEGHALIGDSPFIVLTVAASADVTNCSLANLSVAGELDGLNTIRDCSVAAITNASGFFEKCAFQSTVALNGDSNIFECYSQVPGGGYPVFIVGSYGVTFRDYRGSVGISGAVTGHLSSVGVYGGRVVIDNTCVGGEIHIRGNPFEILDNSGPGCNVVIETESVKVNELHGQVERSVFIDTEALVNGNGYQQTPYDNWTDAIDYAESNGIKRLVVLADIVIDRQLKNFVIVGVGTPTIDCNGQDLTKSEFWHCKIQGSYAGVITVQQSVLLHGFHLNGYFEKCALAGDLFCADGADVLFMGCASGIPGLGRPTVSMNGVGTCTLGMRGQRGGMTIKDCNSPTDTVTVGMAEGALKFASSCTDGEMVARGVCEFTNESNGAAVYDQTVDPRDIARIHDAHYRRRLHDKAANTITLYEEDKVTPKYVFDADDEVLDISPQFSLPD